MRFQRVSFILALCILLNMGVKSQVIISLIFGEALNSPRVEFGLDGGLTLSQMPGLSPSSRLNTFNLGFYFDFKFKNMAWMINTGVLVKSTVGAESIPVYPVENSNINTVFKDGQVTRKLSYFYVPVFLKHKFKSNFFVKGGIQLGLMHKAYDEFSTSIDEDEDLQFSNKIIDNYKRLDAGVTAGIGYRLMGGNGMNLGIQYYEGLMNITKDGQGTFHRNRALYINVGIPIGAAKKKEKLQEAKD
ncbi:MAG: PorT family protein [Bacteroidia bacterium]|nr:PorT family protein [Bacteroidia bacterium]